MKSFLNQIIFIISFKKIKKTFSFCNNRFVFFKLKMHFTFIANACGFFTGSRGTKILTDPWLNDGVFEGSWCHYPPLKTKHEDLQHVDAIYLSHIHPDHYDNRFFDYPRNKPIFILKT